jgi:hypothetical protein
VYCQARATPNGRIGPSAAMTVDYRVGLRRRWSRLCPRPPDPAAMMVSTYPAPGPPLAAEHHWRTWVMVPEAPKCCACLVLCDAFPPFFRDTPLFLLHLVVHIVHFSNNLFFQCRQWTASHFDFYVTPPPLFLTTHLYVLISGCRQSMFLLHVVYSSDHVYCHGFQQR